MLLPLICFAAMPELKLNPLNIYAESKTYIYSIFDIASGAEVAKTKVSCIVAPSTLTIKDSLNNSEATISRRDFSPISGHSIFIYQGTYDITTLFTADSILLEAVTPQGDQNVALERPTGTLLNNDQLLFSLPAMDFSIKKQHLKLFVPANASVIDLALIVEGEQKMTVPAGTFAVFKVKLDLGAAFQYAYYEKAFPHRMIAYDNTKIQYRLK